MFTGKKIPLWYGALVILLPVASIGAGLYLAYQAARGDA